MALLRWHLPPGHYILVTTEEPLLPEQPAFPSSVSRIASLQWTLSQDIFKRLRGSIQDLPKKGALRSAKEEETSPRGSDEGSERVSEEEVRYSTEALPPKTEQLEAERLEGGDSSKKRRCAEAEGSRVARDRHSERPVSKESFDRRESCKRIPRIASKQDIGASESPLSRGAQEADALPPQHTSLLSKSIRKHYLKFQEVKEKASGEIVAPPLPSFFHSCLNQQKEVSLAEVDFVVELVQGHGLLGPPFFEEYAHAVATSCRTCGGPSSMRLLWNSAEEEKCLFARKLYQGTLSSKCDACMEGFRAEVAAELQALRDTQGFLSGAEKNEAVVLRLRQGDFSAHMHAYRIYHWMKVRDIRVRIETIREPSPHFVLESLGDLKRLEKEMEQWRKGEVVKASASACIPHFQDPLDESLSTMNGRRTFMQTCEAQPFASVHSLSHTRHACLKERKEQLLTSVSEESLIGCYRPA
ncbi:MAG: hypothetical protein EBV73_02390 [Rhodocyclales bacterium]|nr:hypothetical protein [Rhodocyclales bacterium]